MLLLGTAEKKAAFNRKRGKVSIIMIARTFDGVAPATGNENVQHTYGPTRTSPSAPTSAATGVASRISWLTYSFTSGEAGKSFSGRRSVVSDTSSAIPTMSSNLKHLLRAQGGQAL